MPKNMLKRCSPILAALALVVTTRAYGQAPAATPDSSSSDDGPPTLRLRAPNTYGAWLAGAHHSSYRTRTGIPGYRDFYLVSLRMGWVMGNEAATVSGRYFID